MIEQRALGSPAQLENGKLGLHPPCSSMFILKRQDLAKPNLDCEDLRDSFSLPIPPGASSSWSIINFYSKNGRLGLHLPRNRSPAVIIHVHSEAATSGKILTSIAKTCGIYSVRRSPGGLFLLIDRVLVSLLPVGARRCLPHVAAACLLCPRPGWIHVSPVGSAAIRWRGGPARNYLVPHKSIRIEYAGQSTPND